MSTMKYRHHKGVRLALTSGHVTTVGTDWQTLHPRYHEKALAAGCQVDQGIIEKPPVAPPASSPQAQVNTDEVSILRKALIKMIERNADNDFTESDKPNLKTLRKEAGIEFDKDVAYRLYEELKAEASAADGEAEADGSAGSGASAEGSATPAEHSSEGG